MAPKGKVATPDAVAEPEAFVRVRALTPLRHDGQDAPEGLMFEVNATAARELVQAGLAELERNDPAELSLA